MLRRDVCCFLAKRVRHKNTSNREQKCDVTLPRDGSTISGWQQIERRRRRQGERQRNKMFISTNNFAGESCNFVHFSAFVAPLRHEISLFHEPALWSRWTQHKNCRFLFLNLDDDRYGPKENFAKICQIKWNWIRSGEVWKSVNRLSSDLIGLLSCKNFATMANWRKDFSSLFTFPRPTILACYTAAKHFPKLAQVSFIGG